WLLAEPLAEPLAQARCVGQGEVPDELFGRGPLGPCLGDVAGFGERLGPVQTALAGPYAVVETVELGDCRVEGHDRLVIPTCRGGERSDRLVRATDSAPMVDALAHREHVAHVPDRVVKAAFLVGSPTALAQCVGEDVIVVDSAG